MKSSLILLAGLMSTFNSYGMTKDPKTMMNEVIALEMAKDYNRGSVTAAAYANQIADAAGFDRIVLRIENSFTEVLQEVVTDHIESDSNERDYGDSRSKTASYDITKIISLNPEETSKFAQQAKRELRQLQLDLRSYVEKNETNLYFSKLLAAKALQLATKMPIENMQRIYDGLMKTVQRVSMINFLGVQEITQCSETFYPGRSTKIKVSRSRYGVRGYRFSVDDIQEAYQEKSCELNTMTESMADFGLNSADLMIADQTLQLSNELLGLKMFSESTAPSYPTWGSPYIE